jgi:hypothetical protein
MFAIYGKFKTFLHNQKVAIASAVVSIGATVTAVTASIASDMQNFSDIIGNGTAGFTGFFVNMMGIFMQPPLLYFVALGIFVTFVHLAGSFLMKRGKK